MTESFSTLRVNADRMLASFIHLASIGATGDGGVSRVTFSEAHLAARKWFRAEIESAGLEFRMDGAGNHSAFLESSITPALAPGASVARAGGRVGGALPPYRDPARSNPQHTEEIASSQRPLLAMTKTLLLGSHLDSVPNGGRFDGALGVLAAFEVLRTIKENRINLKLNLEAIDFTDEEGTLVGLLGSEALAGYLNPEALKNPRGGRQNLVEGMKRAGLSEEGMFNAARPKGSLAGYLELHIEQGKLLERAGIDIGIVSAIVGIRSYRLSFIGRADHAGSTLMEDRLDAGQGASAFTLAAREIVMHDFPNCVVNVGKMEFAPGAFNIVPALVDVLLEFRAADEEEFTRLDSTLMKCAEQETRRFGLELKIEFLGTHSPGPMSANVQNIFADVCNKLGLTNTSLVSGAGHDAQSLVDVCPIGMIFVPSVDGASHAPREFTKWEDCVNGANVLLQAALQLTRL